MKKQILKAIGSAALAILVLAVFAQVPVSAQDNELVRYGESGNKPSLVGTWDVQVLIRDCDTGLPLFGFPAMVTYNQDGTMLELDLGDPALVRLGGAGVWARQNARQYSTAFRFIEFASIPNPPFRTFVKKNVVREAITLSQSSNEYTSTDIVEFFDANGHSIGRACATTTATRFE